MAIRAHAEPHEIRGPGEVLEPRICGIASEPIVFCRVADDRDYSCAGREEGFSDRSDVRKITVDRYNTVVGGDNRHLLPWELLSNKLGEDLRTRASARHRDQRRPACIDRALDDECD